MQSRFIGSFPKIEKCPASSMPEYAFIGRSNVGKSSLINYLLERKQLALVSSTPGKTQMINLIDVDSSWQIADLPGYGYAKVSKKHRASFSKMIFNYLTGRENLICTFVLVDSRIPPQSIDIDFIRMLGEEGIPFTIVYTKFDKSGKKRYETNIEAFQVTLAEEWESLPDQIITSSKRKYGRDDLLSYIVHLNDQWKQIER